MRTMAPRPLGALTRDLPMTATSFRLTLSLALLLALPAGNATASPSDLSAADEQAARAVSARLAQPDAADAIHIDRVEVRDGVAVLRGSVRNRFALAAAIRVTKEVPGIRSVTTHVKVEPNP